MYSKVSVFIVRIERRRGLLGKRNKGKKYWGSITQKGNKGFEAASCDGYS